MKRKISTRSTQVKKKAKLAKSKTKTAKSVKSPQKNSYSISRMNRGIPKNLGTREQKSTIKKRIYDEFFEQIPATELPELTKTDLALYCMYYHSFLRENMTQLAFNKDKLLVKKGQNYATNLREYLLLIDNENITTYLNLFNKSFPHSSFDDYLRYANNILQSIELLPNNCTIKPSNKSSNRLPNIVLTNSNRNLLFNVNFVIERNNVSYIPLKYPLLSDSIGDNRELGMYQYKSALKQEYSKPKQPNLLYELCSNKLSHIKTSYHNFCDIISRAQYNFKVHDVVLAMYQKRFTYMAVITAIYDKTCDITYLETVEGDLDIPTQYILPYSNDITCEENDYRCQICWEYASEDNILTFCELCDASVHVGCYEPASTEFHCSKCSIDTEDPIYCSLCGYSGSLLIQKIENNNIWAHTYCINTIPGFEIHKGKFSGQFTAEDNISKVCEHCGQPNGCIKCTLSCDCFFHFYCAIPHGHYLSMRDSKFYCSRHSREQKRKSYEGDLIFKVDPRLLALKFIEKKSRDHE